MYIICCRTSVFFVFVINIIVIVIIISIIIIIIYIYIYIMVNTIVYSLTHSLTVAIPPGGGIGGAAHNQSVSVPARVPSGCMYTEDWNSCTG